ncbi:MAG TPA: methyltransferase domain-containing protein [Burkholderiaceae bacterium]|nr:methyltransferase domain-containing protein [Burkholderiaceae bacterium]
MNPSAPESASTSAADAARRSGSSGLMQPLSEWAQCPAGQYVLEWEQRIVDELVDDVFGFHALQLGWPELSALRANRMPHRWLAGAGADFGLAADLLIEPEDLPFPAQSLDLIVLAHVLEFAADPHQVLREVERVLVPEGRVVVLGFNPLSLWGARQRLMRPLGPYLPREGQFISPPRLKDWFKLLGMDAPRSRFGCYVPWVRSERWLARWSWMDRLGARWWPFTGSVYAMSAVKHVRGMRLVGAAWKKPARTVIAPVPATSTSVLPLDAGRILGVADAADRNGT